MGKIVAVFPGQASQYVGMGKEWFKRCEIFRQRFSEASDLLGFDLADLCFEGPTDELKKTENTQVAIVAVSVAMFETFIKEKGVRPSCLAGHSIGELSALTASGVFRFSDAIRLARIRGEAMACCNTGNEAGMVAITKMNVELLESLLSEFDLGRYSVQIANYNSHTQTILSGSLDGLSKIGEQLKAHGAKVIPLNVSGPFHSRFMAPASEKLADALKPLLLGNMNIPVMCGHEGRLYTQADDIKKSLAAQLTAPIRWTKVLSELQNADMDEWIEIGPKDVLKNLTLQTISGATVYAYDIEADRESMRYRLKSESEKPTENQSANFIGLCLGAAVCTRNTNWDEAAYQQGVVEPYREMQKMYEAVGHEGRRPAQWEMERALSLLKTIFETKGISIQERAQRFQKIHRFTGTEKLFAERR